MNNRLVPMLGPRWVWQLAPWVPCRELSAKLVSTPLCGEGVTAARQPCAALCLRDPGVSAFCIPRSIRRAASVGPASVPCCTLRRPGPCYAGMTRHLPRGWTCRPRIRRGVQYCPPRSGCREITVPARVSPPALWRFDPYQWTVTLRGYVRACGMLGSRRSADRELSGAKRPYWHGFAPGKEHLRLPTQRMPEWLGRGQGAG